MDTEHVANFVVQLYDVRTKKDGGGRLQLDFGVDALAEIQKLQRWNGTGGCNFALAVVPYREGRINHPEPEIDYETGEVII